MADFKAQRLSSDIQRIIGGKLRDLKDPRIVAEKLTVVRVDVSRYRSVAKVYVSSFDGMSAAKEAVKGLESASGLLRREIMHVLGIRKAPELRFVADDSAEYSAHISKMLKDLNLPQDDGADITEEEGDED